MSKSSSKAAIPTEQCSGSEASLSLISIFLRFRWRVSFTLSLVIVEALLDLLYPLFIGFAINHLLNDSLSGIYWLAGLGGISVVIGSARRFYDTRIYAHIYQTITPEMVAREKTRKQTVSTIVARSSLLTELVEFFENALPEVITSIIGVVGVLVIISTLNLNVFFASLALLSLIAVIYLTIGNLNYRLNTGYNNELECQVVAIGQPDPAKVQDHFRRLMRWNIKLSDLETITYFVLWIGVVALFIYTPVAAIDGGILDYGIIVALLMYVFDYIEKVTSFPLYVQQIIRLREIANRIN